MLTLCKRIPALKPTWARCLTRGENGRKLWELNHKMRCYISYMEGTSWHISGVYILTLLQVSVLKVLLILDLDPFQSWFLPVPLAYSQYILTNPLFHHLIDSFISQTGALNRIKLMRRRSRKEDSQVLHSSKWNPCKQLAYERHEGLPARSCSSSGWIRIRTPHTASEPEPEPKPVSPHGSHTIWLTRWLFGWLSGLSA